jgi:hypothetical protein
MAITRIQLPFIPQKIGNYQGFTCDALTARSTSQARGMMAIPIASQASGVSVKKLWITGSANAAGISVTLLLRRLIGTGGVLFSQNITAQPFDMTFTVASEEYPRVHPTDSLVLSVQANGASSISCFGIEFES